MKNKVLLNLVIIITLLCVSVNANDFFADGKNIYSDNVYMVNTDTGRVVYELDSESLVFPASLTKIMTCILAIEHCESLDELYTIPSGIFDDIYAQGGANMNLRYGEEISVGDLIKATMIRSACDSATALACYVSGSVEEFSKLMNNKAIELGAKNTHFVNAHGLHDENHYTTAKDLFLITEYALKNQTFCDIISEYSCVIPATNKSDERNLSTTMDIENPDKEIYYPYVTGIKSGYTSEAGRCLITKATKNGETYLLITLGANRDRYYNDNMAFTDALTLFEYHFAQYSIQTVVDETMVLATANVANGVTDTVDVTAEYGITALVGLDEKIEINVSLPDEIKAPIKAGDVVGTASVNYGNESTVLQLIATSDVEEKPSNIIIDNFDKQSNASAYMDLVSIILITVSLVVFLILAIILIKNKRAKNRKAKK